MRDFPHQTDMACTVKSVVNVIEQMCFSLNFPDRSGSTLVSAEGTTYNFLSDLLV